MIQSYLVETIVYAHESQKSERFKYIIRRCVHTHVFCLMQEQKVSAFIVNLNPDVHVDFWPPYWCTTVEHQHGGSIQNFIKLHEALRQISQKRFTAQTWELERCSINVSSTTFQVFGLFHWTVSILLFCCGTVKTIFSQWSSNLFGFESHLYGFESCSTAIWIFLRRYKRQLLKLSRCEDHVFLSSSIVHTWNKSVRLKTFIEYLQLFYLLALRSWTSIILKSLANYRCENTISLSV